MADYAVVVGVTRYPDLSADGGSVDLAGPDNDAQDVHAWLVDPAGGNVDPANVRLVSSAGFDPMDPDDPQPGAGRIERELKWVEEQTRDRPGGRLYLYFSGHGFSPVLEEGALFTAEASQVSPSYVYAHAWLRWFRKAQRFREAVLWMDCCMNYQQSIPVNEVLMRAQVGTGVPGPAFVALAAQTRSALEWPMPDGRVHGIFTWTLLQGLRGGASDVRGRVTGESLGTFVYNVMPEFLPDQVRQGSAVDVQPFIRADGGMVFRRLAERPRYPVRLDIPQAGPGHSLNLWTGSPHRAVVREQLSGTVWTGRLVRGLYVAEVAPAGLRQGFQVSGGDDVDVTITRPGPPVIPSDGSDFFDLDVVANPAASITVTDDQFQRIYDETGQVHGQEQAGVYKIRVEQGRALSTLQEDIILLDASGPAAAAAPPPPPAEAVPVAAIANGYRPGVLGDPAQGSGPSTAPGTGGAMIRVISRYPTGTGPADPAQGVQAMAGLELVPASGPSAGDLTVGCRVGVDAAGPLAAWESAAAPGLHVLRQSLPNGQVFEATVVACAGWTTQIALQLRDPGPDGAGTRPPEPIVDAAAAMLRDPAAAREPDQDAVVETARTALGQGRNLLGEGRGEDLRRLLLQEYDDPIAGIIGGHLLLRAIDAAGMPDPDASRLFDALVTRLRGLVGTAHPDVEALSLRCSEASLRAATPFTQPPMFVLGWQLVTDASYQDPGLVPLPLWERVHASTSVGSLFAWAADDGTRRAHEAQLAAWAAGLDGDPTVPGDAQEAARRLHIPLAGTARLHPAGVPSPA